MDLLNVGMSDTIDILELDEMDDIIGGDVDCKRRFKTKVDVAI